MSGPEDMIPAVRWDRPADGLLPAEAGIHCLKVTAFMLLCMRMIRRRRVQGTRSLFIEYQRFQTMCHHMYSTFEYLAFIIKKRTSQTKSAARAAGSGPEALPCDCEEPSPRLQLRPFRDDETADRMRIRVT